jgi:TatA/E family protein of Tat protein translocase
LQQVDGSRTENSMGIENPVHLLFIALVALIVLGPKRLPKLARALGQGIREFRGALEQGASEPAESAPQPAESAPQPAESAPQPPETPPAPAHETPQPAQIGQHAAQAQSRASQAEPSASEPAP